MQKEIGENIYCNDPFKRSRLKTREVFIGKVPLGANHPIRIQSMTNTSTMDTEGSVNQCIRIIKNGADYVRLTTQNIQEAENLAVIKKKLKKKGFLFPLIADVHFNPRVAETAARIVEKIRINPGNFTSSDENGIMSIRKKLVPLIRVCKKNGTAMRIGVNHGSLSNRILEKYGDTPEGMVESAIEYLQICREEDFHQLIFSMKSSNTHIMIRAYRLLVHRMLKDGYVYPIHLGVTEAGEGEDGRIKSAVGIGTLLADGIGDTIRISLTEDPEKEIPVACKFVNLFENLSYDFLPQKRLKYPVNPYQYRKRYTNQILNIGNNNVPVVISDISGIEKVTSKHIADYNFVLNPKLKTWERKEQSPDFLYSGSQTPDFILPVGCTGIVDAKVWKMVQGKTNKYYPIFTVREFLDSSQKSEVLNFVLVEASDHIPDKIEKICSDPTVVLILEGKNPDGFYKQKAFFSEIINAGYLVPIILKNIYTQSDVETVLLASSSDFGGLLTDGLGDGIWLDSGTVLAPKELISLSFGILQASRLRSTKTEYISCPSCGRTLFNIQKVTAKIREKTQHLKGLKIGIMGCIVNGPGEMADADYGYVGSGTDKVTLYKGKKIVRRNIQAKKAVDELINLIKENGDWVEP